jgi:ElaB/YqjD/DUF883 family membrane-anchored ribosome-binding protein
VANEQLTATDKTPEQIQQEMAQTRESLTGKVAALENQVVGTVQTAADTLTDTVESVKALITTAPGAVGDTVKQAAAAVTESVKNTFDIRSQVREHPWTAVGVSALAGCITGWLVSSLTEGAAAAPGVAAPATAYTPATAAASSRSGTGVFDELLSMLGHKLREVAENVVDSATKALNDNVREGVPKLVDAATGLAAERLSTREPTDPRFTGFTG